MGKRELIARELNELPEKDLDTLLGFVRTLRGKHVEKAASMLLAESSLSKDWLTSEEDEAWSTL